MFQIALLEYPTIYFVDGLEVVVVIRSTRSSSRFSSMRMRSPCFNLLAKFFHIAFEDANGLGQRHDFSDYPY